MTSTPSSREALRAQAAAEAAEQKRLVLVARRRAALIAKLEGNALYARDGYVRPQGPTAARPRMRSRHRSSGG
jgi:hypothetical protein